MNFVRSGIEYSRRQTLAATRYKPKLSKSQEDYLEAILLLVRKGRVARVRDIAGQLGVGMPSVTAALKALAARKLVNYDPYQVITLTDKGDKLAAEVIGRHEVLRRFLREALAMDEDSAEANACRLEHAADSRLITRLSRLSQLLRQCPRAMNEWRKAISAPASGPMPATACSTCKRRNGNDCSTQSEEAAS